MPAQPRKETAPDVADGGKPELVPVSFAGHTYHVVANQRDIPLTVTEAAGRQDHLSALRILLGDKEYAAWRSRHSTQGELEDMNIAIVEAMGGNS